MGNTSNNWMNVGEEDYNNIHEEDCVNKWMSENSKEKKYCNGCDQGIFHESIYIADVECCSVCRLPYKD